MNLTLVEQFTYVLFGCPQDVNEITKKHTYAVSGEFCVVFFVRVKFDFKGFITL